jgi:adenylate cyclase
LDREWPWGVAATILATAIWLADPGGLVSAAREAAFEGMGKVFPRTGASGAVVVIDVDRESLARVGPWPLRRSVVARLVERAAADGPRAIALDILLAGEDRQGPAALARELAAASGRADLRASDFPDDDGVLASAIASAGNVVLGVVLDDEGRDPAPPPAPLAVEGTTAGIAPYATAGLLAPYQPFTPGAAGFGVLSFHDGPLGRVAGAPVFALAGSDVFPGLALEAVRIAERAPLLILKNDPNRMAAGSVEVPFDAHAEMRLHFSPEASWAGRTVPAWKLLDEAAEGVPSLAGKLVLIGSSAPEAGAFLPAAGSVLAPTVQIQAEAVDQMLTGRFLQRPAFGIWLEGLAMLAVGLGAVALALQLPPAWTALSAFGIAFCWLAAVATAFRAYGLLIDPIGAAGLVVLAANVTEFAAFIRTRALKTAIQQRFERYVPPEVVARLLREPENLRLDGELREVTALITDVEGFSRMTESADPRALVAVLDSYFDLVTELIVEHGGMVDKIVGDGVLAFFNIPEDLPGHTAAAIRCGEAIVRATEAFRGGAAAAELGFGRTLCGIETGPAVVGDVGGRRRLDYTAYGVVVNKAARFEEANRTLGSSICIGSAAAAAVRGQIQLRLLGRIEVRGLQGATELFEPWGEDVEPELRSIYGEAAAAAEHDPERARKMFDALLGRLPDDRVVRRWLERLPGVSE